MTLTGTMTFICSEPEDGLALTVTIGQCPLCSLVKLAPGYSGLLAVFQVDLSHFLTRYLQTTVVCTVSVEGNIGILLWTSWLNLTNNRLWPLPLWVEVSKPIVDVM